MPYKFHEFADITFSYTFQNQSKYSLSLLTKVAGDPKYETYPLIESFEIEISHGNNQLLVTVIFFLIFFYYDNYSGSQLQKTGSSICQKEVFKIT